jgi:hypothetical protein
MIGLCPDGQKSEISKKNRWQGMLVTCFLMEFLTGNNLENTLIELSGG